MRVFILVSLVLLASCTKVDTREISNLLDGEILIYGHGGLGFDPLNSERPPNTMEGIDLALNGYGIDGVELDVQMLSDGTLVLFHDIYLEGKTNCSGELRKKTWAEISDCKYRNRIPGLQKEHKIPRLDNVISKFSKERPDARFSLHVRTIEENVPLDEKLEFDSVFIERLSEILDKYPLNNPVEVESGDLYFLEKLKIRSPGLMVFVNLKIDESTIKQTMALNLDGFVTGREDETYESIAMAHDSGLYVSLFGMTTANDLVDGFNKSPDFVQVDNVRLAMQVYHEYK
jgi:glycerophosphoryl diester phosphodiesterase